MFDFPYHYAEYRRLGFSRRAAFRFAWLVSTAAVALVPAARLRSRNRNAVQHRLF